MVGVGTVGIVGVGTVGIVGVGTVGVMGLEVVGTVGLVGVGTVGVIGLGVVGTVGLVGVGTVGVIGLGVVGTVGLVGVGTVGLVGVGTVGIAGDGTVGMVGEGIVGEGMVGEVGDDGAVGIAVDVWSRTTLSEVQHIDDVVRPVEGSRHETVRQTSYVPLVDTSAMAGFTSCTMSISIELLVDELSQKANNRLSPAGHVVVPLRSMRKGKLLVMAIYGPLVSHPVPIQ
jgi:hypothetical protein